MGTSIYDRNWTEIQAFYDAGNSIRDCAKHFGIVHCTFRNARLRGLFKPRTLEAAIANNKKTGKLSSYVWTAEQRKAQSDRKKKLYADHPEKHPNRRLANNQHRMSYPEKLAYQFFRDQDFSFQHNTKVDRYFPDFIIDGKLIVEVDGSRWHDQDSDKKRDDVLRKLGYEIVRFNAKNIISQLNTYFGKNFVPTNPKEVIKTTRKIPSRF